MSAVRRRSCGPHATLFELEAIDEVRSLYAALCAWQAEHDPQREDLELVPAARTVLAIAGATVRGRECLASVEAIAQQWTSASAGCESAVCVEVPTVYDGPDLLDVARLVDLDPDAVVRLHSGAEYHVAFCGFAPGFAYLTGLPAALQVARLPTPRTQVPAGSLGVAGEFTGVYPRSSPGGWRLIGRTELALWLPEREPPALLAPGQRVRFVPVAP